MILDEGCFTLDKSNLNNVGGRHKGMKLCAFSCFAHKIHFSPYIQEEVSASEEKCVEYTAVVCLSVHTVDARKEFDTQAELGSVLVWWKVLELYLTGFAHKWP